MKARKKDQRKKPTEISGVIWQRSVLIFSSQKFFLLTVLHLQICRKHCISCPAHYFVSLAALWVIYSRICFFCTVFSAFLVLYMGLCFFSSYYELFFPEEGNNGKQGGVALIYPKYWDFLFSSPYEHKEHKEPVFWTSLGATLPFLLQLLKWIEGSAHQLPISYTQEKEGYLNDCLQIVVSDLRRINFYLTSQQKLVLKEKEHTFPYSLTIASAFFFKMQGFS